MKLLQVIASMSPEKGGTSQGVRNSNAELIKLGMHVEVVSLDSPDAPFLYNDVFLITALGPGITQWQYSKKLYNWLLVNIPRFDAVIVNGLWLYHGYAVRKAMRMLQQMKPLIHKNQKKRDTKVYVMPHGMLDPYFQQAKDRRLKAIRNFIYWKLVESKLINSCDGLFFTCEAEMSLASNSFKPYRPKREVNIGYGTPDPPVYTTDMREAFKEKCVNLEESYYLLFIGRIDKKKGVDLLIKGFINVLNNTEKLADVPKLVIAGPGLDTVFGQEMILLASEYTEYIFFTGMLSGDAKWGAFYGSNAFILPSHQENFGIAVVEALACNRPVLISDQVNIWREIKDGGCGLVAADTQQGVEELITQWIYSSTDEKIEMGMNARFCFEKIFDIKKVSQKLFDEVSICQ